MTETTLTFETDLVHFFTFKQNISVMMDTEGFILF